MKLSCKLPIDVVLACSGGSDSMAALQFLLQGRRNVTLAHFNHGTPLSDEAQVFVEQKAEELELPLLIGKAEPGTLTTELEWRNARYDFFREIGKPVVLAHHLDDAIEWWVFSSLRGKPRLIPPERKLGESKVIRPFLFFTKQDLNNRFGSLGYVNDTSNSNVKFARNRIRHQILPHAFMINPGLRKTVSNLYLKETANA